MNRQVQNAVYRSQITGHSSQVTKNSTKMLDTSLGFSRVFICFISGYVTIGNMFGIDHAFRFCSDSKTTKWRKLCCAGT